MLPKILLCIVNVCIKVMGSCYIKIVTLLHKNSYTSLTKNKLADKTEIRQNAATLCFIFVLWVIRKWCMQSIHSSKQCSSLQVTTISHKVYRHTE